MNSNFASKIGILKTKVKFENFHTNQLLMKSEKVYRNMKEHKCKKYYKNAVLTVEAALVLPIFVMVCYAFLFFYEVINVQQSLNNAATKACDTIASFGYIERYISKIKDEKSESSEDNDNKSETTNASSLFNSIDLQELGITEFNIDAIDFKELLFNTANSLLIKTYVKTYLKSSDKFQYVVGGYEGISFYGSDIYDEDEFVTIYMTYNIQCPVFSSILPEFAVKQCIKMHSFNGHAVEKKNSDEEEDGEYVYVTENGTVYHTHSNCTYIDIKLTSVSADAVDNLRNSNGAKYHACEICVNGNTTGLSTVYITNSGTRYHISAGCSSITRTVIKILKSEVGDRSLCSKCASLGGETN